MKQQTKKIMKKRFVMMAVASMMTLIASSQRGDPNNKYLVWTNNVVVSQEKSAEVEAEEESEAEEEDENTAQGFINKHFKYQSMCDWKEGMRFMVIPDKKDMVVPTFVDAATGKSVNSMTLRHKIMVYKGHSADGGLHERVNFVREDNGAAYYYELPTATFDSYCYSKFGVPTLAYLGDVDTAIDLLIGKKMLTRFPVYNVDISTTSYGYDKINVPLATEVTVVAAGVGTREFPVKLIVADSNGKEFFQTVAISRTNSGLRDEEFEEDNVKHTFLGSFELLGDAANNDKAYSKLIGQNVFTLYKTQMYLKDGTAEIIQRLTPFKILSANAMRGTNKVRLTLINNNKEYTKEVTFKQENVAGDIAGMREDYYYSLFASGNLGKSKSVRQENMADIQNSIVRAGFNEAEVKLALGEPDGKGKANQGRYTWVYKSHLNGNQNCTVFFNEKTKKVVYIKKD